jgi:uncharacterized membrane protein
MLPPLQNIALALPIVGLGINMLNVASARDHAFGLGRGHFVGGFFSFLFSLLLGLLVAGLVYLIQLLRSGQANANPLASTRVPADQALEILRERLAKGEIEVEDYEARRRVLLNQNQ